MCLWATVKINVAQSVIKSPCIHIYINFIYVLSLWTDDLNEPRALWVLLVIYGIFPHCVD